MNYQKVYDDLIAKRLAKPLKKVRVNSREKLFDGVYTETHHIQPLSLGGSDSKENLVELSAREHFIAHKLLFRIYRGTNNESHMAYAFWQMCYCGKDKAYKINKTSRTFALEKEQAIQAISKSLKGRTRINNGKKTRYVKNDQLQDFLDNGWIIGSLVVPWNKGRHDLPPSAMKGKHHTFETRVKISAKCTGSKMPDSMKEKTRLRMIGNKYSSGIHPSKETLEKRSKKLSNRIRINNGHKMKYVQEHELQSFLDSGWKLGMLPLPKETREKLSKALIGRPSPQKGKTLSLETRQKMSASKKGKPPNNKGKNYKIHHRKS